MDFIPYKANECLENIFYQIPKELFINPYYKNLSSDSKLLYALLLDRLSVSMKNQWIDEDGNIYPNTINFILKVGSSYQYEINDDKTVSFRTTNMEKFT